MIKRIEIFLNRWGIFIAAIIFLLLQLPFLHADPAEGVSWSRGPWTDEGLYLSQIRNAINHGHLNINESDCLLKTPLFNLIIYPLFLLFGTKLIVARYFVMLATLATYIYVISKSKKHLGWIFSILLVASQFYVFQYSHFAQAELLQCDFILLALFFYSRQKEPALSTKKQYLYVFLSCMFIALSYYTKISTAYLVVLVPMVFGAEFIFSLFSKYDDKKASFFKFIASLIFTALLFGIYYLCWYLPNQEAFELFTGDELSSVAGFSFSLKDYFALLPFNYNILNHDNKLYFYITYTEIAILIYIVLILYRNTRKALKTNHSPILFIFLWWMIEMHKFGYHYLPQRYQIPTIFAACFMIGFVFDELSKQITNVSINKGRFIGNVLFFLIVFAIGNSARLYVKSYNERHYLVQEMNDYLSHYDLKNDTIIGPWAPSATWESKSYSLPIWKDFYYHDDPINTFHPRIVVSEKDETDSDSAYSKQNINLKAISDSSKEFDIYLWKPVIYWLKKTEK